MEMKSKKSYEPIKLANVICSINKISHKLFIVTQFVRKFHRIFLITVAEIIDC